MIVNTEKERASLDEAHRSTLSGSESELAQLRERVSQWLDTVEAEGFGVDEQREWLRGNPCSL